MSGLDDGLADTALTRLFFDGRRSPEVSAFTLPGGRTLFSAGDQADALYVVRSGRLGAVRRDEHHEQQFLGVIRPGEPAGEMALVAGTPHTATVIALRDTEILSMPREAFFAEARRDPALMAELARLMIRRVREVGPTTSARQPTVYALVGVTGDLDVRGLADRLAHAVAARGASLAVVGSEALAAPTEWFSAVESRHDFVLYTAEAGETDWCALVGRQVDRIMLVGRGDRPPPDRPSAFAAEALRQHRLMDLVLLQPGVISRPRGTEAWAAATAVDRLFHLREGSATDVGRLARVISGGAVGLVLSGGAARAYAHVGAIRALVEAGCPLDFLGGASMGAIIAAGVGMGWDQREIEARIRQAFVDSSPVGDIAFPMIALTRGEQVRRRILQNFDDIDIADLWSPFFCVSSNLTTGLTQVHRHGSLSHALLASSALPGVLPPVVEGDDVLVDGAVMRNFPTDVMRRWRPGVVVGVDVTYSRGLTAKDVQPPSSIWRWLVSGDWRRGPPIVSLLMRTATVTTARDQAASREAADVLILPPVENIEIRNWKAFEPAVEAGYAAAREALEKLGHPVSEFRRPEAPPPSSL